VLMALMASTIGTLMAIPISFIAARNLMQDVKAPLAAIMSILILAPILGGAGWYLARLPVAPLVSTPGDLLPSLEAGLQSVGFIGNFLYVLVELVVLLLPLTVGLIGVLLAVVWGGRYGAEAIVRLRKGPARLLTLALTAVGTAVTFLILAYSLSSMNVLGLREFVPQTPGALLANLILPALVLGGLAGLLTLRVNPHHHFPIGTLVYSLTRGSLNTLRAIEPLMLGFVFVVWVGLGPFAGILALMLNSVADLGKLFSEQVENIDNGPLEAVTASGANYVQSVTYAVVPQITPHYIAYIFYRWDINVRMSTIIGFVGGGGIGFVLQRNINQVLYTRASVMVIAIAVVVTTLDFVSAKIRSKII